jgi:probable HAF family extracellular repeat protein
MPPSDGGSKVKSGYLLITVILFVAQSVPVRVAAQRYTVTDLGTLGGTFSSGEGISDKAWISGFSTLPGDTITHAFLWRDGVVTDLGTLPGDVMSFSEAINDLGEVGGHSCDTAFNCRAFLWHSGKITDFNTLLPLSSPLFLVDVLSINSRGEFVGDAVELSTGENHAYLATPSQSGTETELAAPNTQSLKLVLPENVRRMLRQRLGRRFGTSQLSVK